MELDCGECPRPYGGMLVKEDMRNIGLLQEDALVWSKWYGGNCSCATRKLWLNQCVCVCVGWTQSTCLKHFLNWQSLSTMTNIHAFFNNFQRIMMIRFEL